MSQRIEWQGTEEQQHRERMKACRARCARDGDDCDGDGSCTECEMDMAEALETKESRARRVTALQSPPAKVEGV